MQKREFAGRTGFERAQRLREPGPTDVLREPHVGAELPTGKVRRRGRLAVALALPWLVALPPVAVHAAGPTSERAAGDDSSVAKTDTRLTLPRPTGAFHVGVRSEFIIDAARVDPADGRARALPIRVWYPTRQAGGRRAAYAPARVRRVIENAVQAPAGTLDVDVHATRRPPMAAVRGVILASPGLGNLVAFSTGQVIDLASRGWAVITFDHPGETFVVAQPGGRVRHGAAQITVEQAFAERVRDVRVVLRNLRRLVPRANRDRLAMFGHSLGGATAAEAMVRFPRIDAGVDLDGTVLGQALEEGLDEPFGLMLSNVRDQPGVDDPNLEAFIGRLRGPHPMRKLDIGHGGFTDAVVFNPQAMAVDPALGARLEGQFDAGVDDVIEGVAALSAQRRFLSRFMRHHVTR